jgi:hypothetical protein
MQDAADHTPIIRSFFATNVSRQVRFDLLPLLIVEPEQIRAHRLNSRAGPPSNR